MRYLAIAAVLLCSSQSTAQDEVPTTDTLPENAAEVQEDRIARSLTYPSHCEEYIARGGPLAGVVVGPVLSLAGTGMAIFGSGEKTDGAVNGKGKGLIAAGTVMAVSGLIASIVSGDRLRDRNKARRQQTLTGCPGY